MKFYGLEIGCTEFLHASSEEEVITITVFGKNDLYRVFDKLPRSKDKFYLVNSLLKNLLNNAPSLTRIPKNLKNAKELYAFVAMHYLIPEQKLKDYKKLLNKIFPSSDYVQL